MFWISPLGSLILWVLYLGGCVGCIYFFLPVFGGWNTLNGKGKAAGISCLVLCLACMWIFVMTFTTPL